MTSAGIKPFEVLRGLARPRDATDRCELCGAGLAQRRHEHVFDTKKRRVLCTCAACALLFSADAKQDYKRVPRRVLLLEDLDVGERIWDRLAIPIGLTFFVRRDDGGASAVYPSPAGPVESLLPLREWEDIFTGTVAVVDMQPDVEAVLMNRSRNEYYIAPIDECYRLTGLIRKHWRGLSGGAEVSREMHSFFEEMKRRAGQEAAHA